MPSVRARRRPTWRLRRQRCPWGARHRNQRASTRRYRFAPPRHRPSGRCLTRPSREALPRRARAVRA
ncbi:MAG: hypothetical protein ACK55I_17065, partial [bacterium]